MNRRDFAKLFGAVLGAVVTGKGGALLALPLDVSPDAARLVTTEGRETRMRMPDMGVYLGKRTPENLIGFADVVVELTTDVQDIFADPYRGAIDRVVTGVRMRILFGRSTTMNYQVLMPPVYEGALILTSVGGDNGDDDAVVIEVPHVQRDTRTSVRVVPRKSDNVLLSIVE